MKPVVSIITATYNSAKYIGDTIESVLNQTHQYWELIIIDDASTDDTISIVKQYQKGNPKIHLLQNDNNSGAAVTRNRGVSYARGRYIAFLDGDDLWKPHKLAVQVSFMLENAIAVSYSSYEWIDETGSPLAVQIKALPELSSSKIEKSNYIGNLTGMYDTTIIGKIEAPLLRKRQDWGVWIFAIRKAGKAYGIPDSLAYYRVRQGSISSNKLDLIKYNYNVYRKALGYNMLKSSSKTLIFLLEHFFVKNKLKIRLS